MRAPAWALIAGAELRMLSRSAPALVMGAVLPTALGLLIVWAEHDTGKAGRGTATGMQVAVLLALTTYTAGTTTLVSRRAQSVLKRLRMSGATDAALLTGILLPAALLTLLQVAVMVVAGGSRLPGRAWAPIVAVGAGILVAGLFAVVTSAWTSAPELAQFATTPLALTFLGGSFWAARTPASEVEWWMLMLPGAPVTQLARLGWNEPGITATEGLVAAEALVILAEVGAPIATRAFRWDPRL